MLRFLRIIGIIAFACLIGHCANSLWGIYEAGEMFEKYNNAPKMYLTLMGFGIIILSALSVFEVASLRNLGGHRRYGRPRVEEDDEVLDSGSDTSSIYATPPTITGWQGKRPRRSGRKHKKRRHKEPGMFWMRLLQLISLVLSVGYPVLLYLNLMNGHEEAWITILLSVAFGILFIISLIVVVGTFMRKNWGLVSGYTLVVCNLLIFPYGTAVGLLLVISLVGSSRVFEGAALTQRRKESKRKSAERSQYSTT